MNHCADRIAQPARHYKKKTGSQGAPKSSSHNCTPVLSTPPLCIRSPWIRFSESSDSLMSGESFGCRVLVLCVTLRLASLSNLCFLICKMGTVVVYLPPEVGVKMKMWMCTQHASSPGWVFSDMPALIITIPVSCDNSCSFMTGANPLTSL